MNIDIKRFKPIGDLVLVKVEPVQFVSKSGLITQTKKHFDDRPTEGVVVGVGDKVDYIKIGDIVKFENIRGYDIDKNYMLLGASTILGIIERKEAQNEKNQE